MYQSNYILESKLRKFSESEECKKLIDVKFG